MNKRNYIYIFLLLIVSLSSCVMSKRLNYLQEGRRVPVYDSIAFDDYQLQKGDYVYVRVNAVDMEMADVFNGDVSMSGGTQQMNADNPNARLYLYLVEEDFCIDYPYVGKLNVEGKTLRDVKLMLEEELKSMLKGFSVDVRLANRSFSVIGESGSGRYEIPREKLTIFEALAMSGDLSLYAKRKDIHIIRQTPKGTEVKVFDLRSKSIIDSEFYYIQPNDVIYVPFSNAKHWGASHFTGVLSLAFTTISFGMFIYSIVNTIIKASTPQ